MFAPSESLKSTRDGFIDDMTVDWYIDNFPFDEPPNLGTRSRPIINYKLDSYSFYHSLSPTENSCINENYPTRITNTISKKLDSRMSLAYDFRCIYEDNDNNSICGSSDGHSDVSLFLSAHQIVDKDSVNDFYSRRSKCGPCECYDCGTMVGNFNSLCELPMLNFRSKPLPKPVIWKGYTCFRGKCPDSSAAAGLCHENKFGEVSVCQSGYWQDADIHSKFCQDAMLTDPKYTCVALEDSTYTSDVFQGKSIQDYVEYAKTSTHQFLKRLIFVEDTDFYISNDNVEDFDSITCSSTSSLLQEITEDENDRWRWNIAI